MEGSAAAQEVTGEPAAGEPAPAVGLAPEPAAPEVATEPASDEPAPAADLAGEPAPAADLADEPAPAADLADEPAPAADLADEPAPAADETPAPAPAYGETDSHLFAIKTTGGQEKVVMNMLEAKTRLGKLGIQSVLLVDNLKGYVVIEASDPNLAYGAIDGVRHIRGQLRGELAFGDIEGYLVKRSSASQLAVDATVEITGGPFKGMKATVSRIDAEKEEATVVLLDAAYQLPVTVDANYLKPVKAA
ncbi:MAG: transcription elongation factor Spt5 [Thaumarchaeota archaeon]|nr:transcription elongation factor Spt5 [Nitrososphaerota archaeon]